MRWRKRWRRRRQLSWKRRRATAHWLIRRTGRRIWRRPWWRRFDQREWLLAFAWCLLAFVGVLNVIAMYETDKRGTTPDAMQALAALIGLGVLWCLIGIFVGAPRATDAELAQVKRRMRFLADKADYLIESMRDSTRTFEEVMKTEEDKKEWGRACVRVMEELGRGRVIGFVNPIRERIGTMFREGRESSDLTVEDDIGILEQQRDFLRSEADRITAHDIGMKVR